MSVGEDLLASRRLQTLLPFRPGRKKSREHSTRVYTIQTGLGGGAGA